MGLAINPRPCVGKGIHLTNKDSEFLSLLLPGDHPTHHVLRGFDGLGPSLANSSTSLLPSHMSLVMGVQGGTPSTASGRCEPTVDTGGHHFDCSIHKLFEIETKATIVSLQVIGRDERIKKPRDEDAKPFALDGNFE